MRTSARCPKCDGTKLYVCDNRQPDGEFSNVIHPFVITTVPLGKDAVGAKSGTRHRTHVGTYETWICAGCGYTEWYAKDPEQLLEKLARMPASGVRVVTVATMR
jgi:predicted nucleic-acid-binding Zn-ribbon protein